MLIFVLFLVRHCKLNNSEKSGLEIKLPKMLKIDKITLGYTKAQVLPAIENKWRQQYKSVKGALRII